MKLHPVRLANAVAISQAILTIICAALAYAAPDFVIRVARSFSHPLDISPLIPVQARPFDLAEFFLGLVSWTVLIWISGWLAGVVYNAIAGTRSEPSGATHPDA